MPGYEGPILLSALDASLLYSTSETLNASVALTEFGDASEAFFRSRGLIGKVRVPLPPKGTTRRLVYDRSLRPFLSVALRIDHADGVIAAARAVVGGCHRWPFWCDLPVDGLSLPDFHGQADGIAIAAVRQMPPPTVAWFGLPHYREKVAPVLLSRLIREIAS
jgi:CO/xanthine dehydrogenase FAD-binding subunit